VSIVLDSMLQPPETGYAGLKVSRRSVILEMLFGLCLPIAQRLDDCLQKSQHFWQLLFQSFSQLLDAWVGQLFDPLQGFFCQPLVDGPIADFRDGSTGCEQGKDI
jgi:hypothetical protein